MDLAGTMRARKAAANHRYLRSVGVTPRSAVDVLIASYCASEGLDLLADDRDFQPHGPHARSGPATVATQLTTKPPRRQSTFVHERAEARPARPRLRPAARGGPARVDPARARPGAGLRPGRRHREEAGRRHRRRDVEGDPRRPVRGRGADRHSTAQQGPQPRLRPAGARSRGGADHGDPLPGQCRHGQHAAPSAPSSSTARPSRPDCCCRRRVHARTRRCDKKHERIIGSTARPHPAAQPAARRPAATGRARPRRVARRRAGGRGRSVRRIAAPLAAGDDRAPDPARDRDQGAAEKRRAADRRQRQRRLRGVVREAAEGAVRAGGPARKPQGRHRGGDQAQPALAARAVSLLLPPAGAGASVRPGLRQRRGSRRPSRPRSRRRRARPSRPCARGSPACSTAPPRGCPRSSTSPRRSAPSNGRNGRTIAARSISGCCAGRWTAPSSTGRRSTGSAARRSCGECRADDVA